MHHRIFQYLNLLCLSPSQLLNVYNKSLHKKGEREPYSIFSDSAQLMFVVLLACAAAERVCTRRVSPRNVTTDTINSVIGRNRPVYLRMALSGCAAAPGAASAWNVAAEIFPQISFIELDCLGGGFVSEDLCAQYETAAK